MEKFLEISELVKKKDRRALELLYDQYGASFYSYCIDRWNLEEDDAWDVVYKTLETLVLKLSNYSFSSNKHFERFIFRVLINFLRQNYRAANSKTKNVEFIDMDGLDAGKAFEKYLNAKSLQNYFDSDSFESPMLDHLAHALEQLEAKDRDLLLLRAQNFSYEEIASMLNVSAEHLKVQHHRAKKKLINLLNSTSNL